VSGSLPRVTRTVLPSGEVRVRLGVRLLDDYLEFAAGRARPNTRSPRIGHRSSRHLAGAVSAIDPSASFAAAVRSLTAGLASGRRDPYRK
jgi:hypothetical protein